MSPPELSPVYSVAEINAQVRALLLKNFSDVSVRGEISGLRQYASGHWYFTLKDAGSEISCAMFRSSNRLIAFEPKDGDVVRVTARIDIFIKRGRYQLIVEDMEPEGRGALLRKLEEIKARLKAEGLFDPERKQPLPAYAAAIGVITSENGAALRDIARTLRRRWPTARLCVYPARVQGAQAPASLLQALDFASRDGRVEVLILARGGGSFEDLMAFNDEALTRAVAACPIPLITGIGHETDTSLVDFAADVRAATPTAAAELASPDATELKQNNLRFLGRAHRFLEIRLQQARRELKHHLHRLEQAHPIVRIQGHQQRLDEASGLLVRRFKQSMERRRHRSDLAQNRLLAGSPKARLERIAQTLKQQQWRIESATRALHQTLQTRLARAGATLDAISPLRTLERGYAIATRPTDDGPELIRAARQTRVGDPIDLRLSDGSVAAKVTATRPAAKKTATD